MEATCAMLIFVGKDPFEQFVMSYESLVTPKRIDKWTSFLSSVIQLKANTIYVSLLNYVEKKLQFSVLDRKIENNISAFRFYSSRHSPRGVQWGGGFQQLSLRNRIGSDFFFCLYQLEWYNVPMEMQNSHSKPQF